jgi:hypothetical protein
MGGFLALGKSSASLTGQRSTVEVFEVGDFSPTAAGDDFARGNSFDSFDSYDSFNSW